MGKKYCLVRWVTEVNSKRTKYSKIINSVLSGVPVGIELKVLASGEIKLVIDGKEQVGYLEALPNEMNDMLVADQPKYKGGMVNFEEVKKAISSGATFEVVGCFQLIHIVISINE